VWVTLYSSFFSGVARTWTLVDARLLCYNRYTLSSPFCPPFHRPSLMNSVIFSSRLKHHNHHPSALYSYSHVSPLLFCLTFCHYCCRCCSGALYFILLGNNIPFTTSLHPPHTFFRNFSRIHISSSPSAGLPQSSPTNKKNPLSHRCA